jgi:5-carboxymethyl-2-hydroxymuconate isomerase
MPHLIIQYSENLGEQVNMTEFCAVMSKAIQQTGLFPLAGIRVCAHPMPHSSITDEHPNNAFADFIF